MLRAVDIKAVKSPFEFTSSFSVKATPDQVVNGTTPTGGLPVSIVLHFFNYSLY